LKVAVAETHRMVFVAMILLKGVAPVCRLKVAVVVVR
jgi:hypothetical protein